jgi:Flp pilus assembly pilin Flp
VPYLRLPTNFASDGLLDDTMKRLLRQLKKKRGQTLVEYALILAFISVVAISVLVNVGTNLKGVYTRIDSSLSSAQASH